MSASPKTRVSKHQRAYRVIRERIIDGTYGPGYRLVLDALARELEVSPVPVREAVRQLEAEGWVNFERNVGAQVVPLDERQWEEAMHALALLEGHVTALAAPNMRPADLERAQRLNDEMRSVLQDMHPARVGELNREFHFTFYERCSNEYLKGLMLHAWDRLDAMRNSSFHLLPSRAAASADEHDEILKLVASGASAKQIERVARQHKLNTVAAHERLKAARNRRSNTRRDA